MALTIAGVFASATLTPAIAAAAPSSGATASTVAASRRLEFHRYLCNYEIDRRVFILAVTDNWISGARHLTDAQRASMLASDAEVAAHLRDVNRPAVNAAGDEASLSAACNAIFTDNRVYAVVVPQVLLTIRDDQLADAVERLGELSARKAAEGHDTSQVDAWLTDASAHVTAAQAAVSSVTVDSFNADPDGARAAFESAKADQAAAYAEVIDALRALGAM